MLDTLLNELWQNWMFRISLSSNELFHSNFLQTVLEDSTSADDEDKVCLTSWPRVRALAGWARLDPAWIDRVQEKFGDCPVFVHREWKDLDLAVVVRVQDGARKPREIVLFALELKIKSYPTHAQLDRYLQEMETHNGDAWTEPRLALLSLITPLRDLRSIRGLSIMDFAQLAAGLRELAPSSAALAPALGEYVRCCESLHQLSQFWKQELDSETTLADVTSKRSAYRRMFPIWSKLCAAYVCEQVERDMKGFPAPAYLKLEVVPGFSNGNWSADFLWCKQEHSGIGNKRARALDEVVAKVGVQIEGDTIRFMLNARNVAPTGGKARSIVERVLIGQASSQTLYQHLHALYQLRQAKALDSADHATLGFWDAHRNVLVMEKGLPTLSTPRDKKGFQLPGYNNNSDFGHADYRLKLSPAATLGQISKIIAAALKGEFNGNGHPAFLDVLTNPEAFEVES